MKQSEYPRSIVLRLQVRAQRATTRWAACSAALSWALFLDLTKTNG
ncbi:hypothetical protein [Hymenobacter pini]|nr:hypothetical protein [Hymenobacter pini]MCA8830554.1 hypothetical protein [Hymenobacter pini]